MTFSIPVLKPGNCAMHFAAHTVSYNSLCILHRCFVFTFCMLANALILLTAPTLSRPSSFSHRRCSQKLAQHCCLTLACAILTLQQLLSLCVLCINKVMISLDNSSSVVVPTASRCIEIHSDAPTCCPFYISITITRVIGARKTAGSHSSATCVLSP